MVFKNSCKLFFANFSTMWKMLLYYIFCIGVGICLFLPVLGSVSDAIQSSGVLNETREILANFNISANIFELFSQVYIVFTLVFEVTGTLFATTPFDVVYIFFLLFWLLPYIFSFAEIPTCEMIYGYMSSCTKYGFTSTLIRRLKTSSVVGLFRTTFKAMFSVLTIVIFFYIVKITELGGILYYLAPLFMIAILVVCLSISEILFGGWLPSIVVLGSKNFPAFKKGITNVFKNFLRNFSTLTMVILVCIMVNYFFGTFAFIVTIPMSIYLVKTTNMVIFFTSQGMRYYVDIDTIITPQKFEESDNFKKVVDIL